MKPGRLTDDAVGDALVVAADRSESPAACAPDARIWDAVSGALEPAAVRAILDHAAVCPSCSLTLRIATAVAAGAAPAVPAGWLGRVWSVLSATILHPAPALAYLLLLALSYPVFRMWPDRPATSPALVLGVPRVVALSGDVEQRGETALAPLRLSVVPGELLLLKLYPDPDDLPGQDGSRIVVRLLDADTILSESSRTAEELEGDGSIPVVLETSRLRAGSVYRVELRPLSTDGNVGDPVFRQTLVLATHE